MIEWAEEYLYAPLLPHEEHVIQSYAAEQAQKILGLNRATYFKYKKAPEAVNLSQDQLERLSYVINIHAALRVVFDNPENVYGFIKMPNHNPYFNGKTPLELISTGHFANLYEVYKRIDALRGAG